jgi:hypothetical protein
MGATMATTTADTSDGWAIVHDLIFGIPAPVLAAVDYLAVLLVIAALVGVVVRLWKGDRLELGPVVLERPELLRYLEESFELLGKDDRLKANVLWVFRERLNEANRIMIAGADELDVHAWCHGVLTDAVMTLSEGGHDRHRASLWIRVGDELRVFDGVGFRQEAIERATLPLASIAGNVLQTGTPYNSRDVDADNAFCPKPRSGQPYRSLLSVPVKTPLGGTVAALCVDAEARAYFDRDHEFFANCFADLTALLLAQVIPGDAH